MRCRAIGGFGGAIVMITVLLPMMGCSRSSSEGTPGTPSPVSKQETPRSHTPAVESAEAVDAYRAMWRNVAFASRTSDPASPLLDDHATGGALTLFRYMLREDRKKGVVTKGRLHLSPTVVSSESARVLVRDCADATDWLHYTKDGTLENDDPGGHHRVDATIRRRAGQWRVERLYIGQVGTC
jgi:hypothetical protein